MTVTLSAKDPGGGWGDEKWVINVADEVLVDNTMQNILNPCGSCGKKGYPVDTVLKGEPFQYFISVVETPY